MEVYRQLHFSNASLSIIELGDDPRIRLLNDTCHLDLMGTEGEDFDLGMGNGDGGPHGL